VPRGPGSSDTLIVSGRPSFTRLRRVSIGLVNERPDVPYGVGQMWFNELRAIDVAKDRGHAQRLALGGRMANLFQYNFTWNGRDADFLSVGETRGSGSSNDSYALSSNIDVHRFFEGTGIVLPVSFNFSQNTSRPRFSAGDDVVRGGRDLERSESFNDSRGWSVAFSRSTGDRANPFIKYSLGGISANFSAQNSHGRNPVTADQSTLYSGSVNYSIAPRSALPLHIPLTKARLFPLPERFYVNYRSDERRSATADRLNGTDTFIPRSLVGGRSAGINVGMDLRPFDFLHHHYEAVRNLNLQYRPVPRLFNGSLNLGSVVSWSQNLDANYTLRFGNWLKPQLGWNSHYNQNNGPELSPDLSIRSISNGQQGTVRWELPFETFARANATRPDTGRSARHSVLWRRLLSRLGNLGTDFSVRKSSGYSRLVGKPDFLYLFGLSDNPGVFDRNNPAAGFRMIEAAGDQSNRNFDWRTGMRTTVKLPWSASVQTSGEFSSQTGLTNGAQRGQDQMRFPDLQFDYGQLATAIRLDRLLRNPRLRTAFNRSTSTDYNNGRANKSSESRSFQFQPLLELGGDLGSTRLQLSVEHRSTEREVLQLGRSVQYEANTDLNMNLNRSYSAGQKITFLGRESTVRSSVNIGVATVYSRQTGRIEQLLDGRMQPSNQSSRDRLSVNANGSYGFSSNVSGNAVLGFSQDQDKIRKLINRSVRVELSARFSF
jgi:hypothetical protein